MIEAIGWICGAVLVYCLGYRAGHLDARRRTVVLFAIPRDDMDIDIPRLHETRRGRDDE